MHILIATTGVLPPGPTAALCSKLWDESTRLTVMTVIEVPRTFLESMDEDERRSFLHDGDWETQTAELKALGYLEERGKRAVDPIVSALALAHMDAEVAFVEDTDPAEAIIRAAREREADLIMMGATKRLFTEQSWTSVSNRVMERTQCPLLLVPSPRIEEAADPRREP
ncbi:MAG TPA: universal stress protein [Acidimicrobiia bacterium]